MKRTYVRPTMVGERFVANEYVAACGDSGKVYKFECNAGDGVPGNVYQETNGESGLQRWPSKPGSKPDTNLTSGLLTSYHACGERMAITFIVQHNLIWMNGRQQSHKK